jgi:nitroimidazol reductase NimA-like FMN-containing flavoprotein (pyridoxamine 5'-phosphate oxidase superfamily)
MSAADVAAYTQVRRKDREVADDDWIRDFLRRAPAGTLATVHDGQPFVNMNVFVYAEDENAIYFHTARTGRTRANIEADERVCFGVSTMGRLLPAERAKEFSVEYAGVVVFGRGEVVTDEAEARAALQRLLDKYFPHLQPGRDYRPTTAEELAVTTVYRIRIDGWSGKQKAAPDDFPGAFRYGELPTPATATAGEGM